MFFFSTSGKHKNILLYNKMPIYSITESYKNWNKQRRIQLQNTNKLVDWNDMYINYFEYRNTFFTVIKDFLRLFV